MKKHLLCLVVATCAVALAAAEHNLVVIVVDQIPHWATDPAQRAPLEMPNLDKLAAQGRVFERAYVTSPVCSENRLALLTGQYPFSLGVGKLEPGVETLGTILSRAGWETGYVGKYHLSPSPDPSGYVHPADRPGWDFFAGMEGAPHNYANGKSFINDDPTPLSTAPWAPTWHTKLALRFLRAEREDHKPFCLVLNIDPPHPAGGGSYVPPTVVYTSAEVLLRPNVLPAEAAQARKRYAQYMSLCATTDAELGTLLAEVDLTTTFVVLTSDHGDNLFSHGMQSKQQKRHPWEESVHIPLIIAGPGIAPGSEAGLVSTVDLLPSILSLLGVAVPAEVQGSALPTHRAVYNGHDLAISSWNGERWRGLVDGHIKYAVTESGGAEVLYDLAADPYELVNLVGNPAFERPFAALRTACVARGHELGDPFFPSPAALVTGGGGQGSLGHAR